MIIPTATVFGSRVMAPEKELADAVRGKTSKTMVRERDAKRYFSANIAIPLSHGERKEPELLIDAVPLKPVDGAGLSIRGITLYFEQ